MNLKRKRTQEVKAKKRLRLPDESQKKAHTRSKSIEKAEKSRSNLKRKHTQEIKAWKRLNFLMKEMHPWK